MNDEQLSLSLLSDDGECDCVCGDSHKVENSLPLEEPKKMLADDDVVAPLAA